MLGVLINPDGKSDVDKWSLAFVIVGLIDFAANIGKFAFLGVAGEALTRRLRGRAFRAMLYQETDWFDEPRHRKNILTARLASDASRVRGIVGERLGVCKSWHSNYSCLHIYVVEISRHGRLWNFGSPFIIFFLVVSVISTIIGGVAVAMIYCWKIGLVVLAACPAVAIGGALQMTLMTGFSQSKEF